MLWCEWLCAKDSLGPGLLKISKEKHKELWGKKQWWVEGSDGGTDRQTWPLDESHHLSVLMYHCLLALEGTSNPFDPPPPLLFIPPSHPSLRHRLLHPPIASTCYVPPEGIIFTLTTSINLNHSCTQAHTLTHTPPRPCLHTYISLPISITGVKVTGLGGRSFT